MEASPPPSWAPASKILKLSSDISADVLQNHFNDTLLTENFQYNMKLADLTPVFKNKKLFRKGNYRPVSVQSILFQRFLKNSSKKNRRLHKQFLVSILMWLYKSF